MCPKGPVKKYLPIYWARKQPITLGQKSFCLLDWDILISSFKNIKLSFIDYLSLQALEVHKYEDIENQNDNFSESQMPDLPQTML